MTAAEIFDYLHDVAENPRKMMSRYLAQGEKVVLCAPIYTPEEVICAMGAVPFGIWGADLELNEAKRYFPAFLCSIVQSCVELGMRGSYQGASAVVIPALCDTLKVLGENWKYAVPSIPFIPMVYPQNRQGTAGRKFVKANYLRVANDLAPLLGTELNDENLQDAISIYNKHNAVMRAVSTALAAHPEVTAQQRSDVFKSAFFMKKTEHTKLMEQLLDKLIGSETVGNKVPVFVSGILTDALSLNEIFDELGYQIVGDDVAAQSRQYRVDAPEEETALDSLAEKFCTMGDCSVLYDPRKNRRFSVPERAKACGAKGVIFVMTKFCDPEEFDYPLVRKGCEEAGLPCAQIEVDRQMNNYAQARTILETFRDMIG